MNGTDTGEAPQVAVLGAGRMGRELVAALAEGGGAMLAGVWARDGGARLLDTVGDAARAVLERATLSPDLDAVLARAEVAVDFTLAAATPAILDSIEASGTPLVCGVSGLDDAVMRRMRGVAESVPVFHDRNMSFGIAVMTELVTRAGAMLGPDFVAEVHEAHHVHKRDAPSGTALKLGEALAAARRQDFGRVYRYSERRRAERHAPDDIVFLVTREGENPGEHTVVLRSAAETLELAHRVKDRRVFAQGALRAARWLVGQPAGFWQMRDLVADRRSRR